MEFGNLFIFTKDKLILGDQVVFTFFVLGAETFVLGDVAQMDSVKVSFFLFFPVRSSTTIPLFVIRGSVGIKVTILTNLSYMAWYFIVFAFQ